MQMLSENRRFSLPAAAARLVWSVGWVGHVVKSDQTGSDERCFVDEVMTHI